jgi:amino acid adenylation domain-containing protein/non-ribosomal peptide synthase protein (TIGR01720 family)
MRKGINEIVDIILTARSYGIEFNLNEGKLQLKLEESKEVEPGLLERIRNNKEAIIDYLKTNTQQANIKDNAFKIESIQRIAGNGYPLSFSQERLWFIDRLEGSVQYHIPFNIRLKGKINKNALEFSLKQLIHRHEILRTVIIEREGEGQQSILDKFEWSLKELDGSIYGTQDLRLLIQQLNNEPFDLSKDLMIRGAFINLNETDNILVLTVHHIAYDAWSTSIIIKELVELYNAFLNNENPKLSIPSIQYIDYAVWQRNYLSGENLKNKLAYWKSKLDGSMALELPIDKPRPAFQSIQGSFKGFKFNKQLTSQLEKVSQSAGTTMFMTLLSAFNILLHRLSGQTDIIIGTPVTGRQQKELEHLIGYFINTLALRNEINADSSFDDLLAQIRQNTMDAFQHQEVPFEKVVDAVVHHRDMSRSPLFQVMFVFQNSSEMPSLKLGDAELVVESSEIKTVKFELQLSIVHGNDGLKGGIQYCTDLFEETGIDRMLVWFEQILINIGQNNSIPISKINLVTASEQQLLESFNQTKTTYPEDKTIIDYFESNVNSNPNAIAVEFEDRALTYAELNTRVNQLAHYLIQNGAQAETLIPICLERSFEMLIGILAILKSGSAYVPIDPEYPTERIAYMLEDIKSEIVLTTSAFKSLLSATTKPILLDSDSSLISSQSSENPNIKIGMQDLAYVIYTSGSTGKPKGVMNQHDGLINRLQWTQQNYGLTSTDKVLQKTPFSFDVSVWEFLWPMLSGSTLVFAKPSGHREPEYLINLIESSQITLLHFVPSMLEVFLAELAPGRCAGLRQVLCSGEALGRAEAELFKQKLPNTFLDNLYGPTEAAIDVSYWRVPAEKLLKDVPIGKPVANTKLYVVNSNEQQCPVGIPGELYIEGIQVARGYLNRPELTQERFKSSPFTPGERVYRTGDLARWLPDGTLEYLGRIDDQVKIRGFRIELGEIESEIQASGLVKQALVIASEHQNTKRLIGYIIPESTYSKEKLEGFLRSRLPEYMVPLIWVELESIPLTPNGKVDKRALPKPDLAEQNKDRYVAPITATEIDLTNIWQDLLGVNPIGIHDNFFELGGDSIMTIQLVSRAVRLGYRIQPKDIFIHQTIASLSQSIADRLSVESKADQGMLIGNSGLLPIQRWYLEGSDEERSHFNQSFLFSIDKSISGEILEKCVKDLLTRHDALRFSYRKENSRWEQTYTERYEPLIHEDYTEVSEETLAKRITESSNRYQASLNIETGEIIRVVWMKTPQSQLHNRLLIIIHHLAVDGVSWRILLEDLELLLDSYSQNQKPDLGTKSSSYRQWYEALRVYGESEELQSQKAYWQKVNGQHQLPVDKAYDKPVSIQDFKTLSVKLGKEQTKQLIQQVPKVYHTEVNDILLAALAQTISQWSLQQKVSIGMEGHGREDVSDEVDVSRTMGWFTSLYPIVLELEPKIETGDLIKSIKEQLRKIPVKGIGYGVLKYINEDPTLQGSDPWEIVFNYLGQLDNAVKDGKYLHAAKESAGTNLNSDKKVSEKLSISSSVRGGDLHINWSYSSLHFNDETLKKLADAYVNNLNEIIENCLSQTNTFFTPSDFNLGNEISFKELDKFLDKVHKGKSEKQKVTSIYRLSGLQSGMFFHSLYNEETTAYKEFFSWDLINVLPNFIQESWNYVLKNHSILRSAFFYNAFDIPVQCVFNEVDIPIEWIDLSLLPSEEQKLELEKYKINNDSLGFEFENPPLMRLAMIKLSEERYRMFWTSHHIIFDGWSLPILTEEFLKAYETLVSGNKLQLKTQDNFEDYIRYIERNNKYKEKKYWQTYLQGLENPTLLPFVSNSADRNKGIGKFVTETIIFDKQKAVDIQAFAQKMRLTVNTLMQGVWSFLLHQYTGIDKTTFGVVVSGRPDELPGIEKRVGLYINTIPFYSNWNEAISVIQWLSNIQNEQINSRQFQYTPLQTIQGHVKIQGDLFDSIVVFENYPVSKVIGEKQWKLKVDKVETHDTTNYPLTIIIANAEKISIRFVYNSTLINQVYINQITKHFENTLFQIIPNINSSVSELSLLSKHEEIKFLKEINTTEAEFPQNKTLVNMFVTQVEKSPNSIAISFGAQTLTYAELDQKSNQLAHYLISNGIRVEDFVPICVERGFEMIIGILAILKAGAVYVPIDPEYPRERIDFIIEDTSAKIVLTDQKSKSKIPNGKHLIIELDSNLSEINRNQSDLPQVSISPKNLAYVIYTSGSTGKPKGVLIEHLNVVRLFETNPSLYDFNSSDVWTLFHSFCFDFSVWEMYGALLFGGRLVIVPYQVSRDPHLFANLLLSEKVTVLNQTPSAFYVLQDEISQNNYDLNLRYVIFGGEALNPGKLLPWKTKYPACRLINMYGITETTVHVTYQEIEQKHIEAGLSVIGKPIPTLKAYILNHKQKVVPFGVIGELYIGGYGVARGYLNRPELTLERFIPDMFDDGSESKLYRTGDLARWLPDGTLEYLGRIDDQVKIRGFRIELGEIESEIQASQLVKQALVIASEHQNTKRLIGYIIPESTYSKEKLEGFLRSRLPEYMVPLIWVELESIPLTPNGKVDKRALPKPDLAEQNKDRYVAPITATEIDLTSIWQDLLGVNPIGIHDNFFELGGDSIMTIQLVSRAVRLGYRIQPKDIFIHQTIASLSQSIADRLSVESKADQGMLIGNSGLLPIQRWYLEGSDEERSHFNQSFLFSIDKSISGEILEKCVKDLLARHDALRFSYRKENSRWEQTYTEHYEPLIHEDYTEVSEETLAKRITESSNRYQASLNIETGEIIRVVWMKTPQSQLHNRLLIIIHHLAVDGVSWRILLEDLELLLDSYSQNQKPDLGTKSSSYRQWYEALRVYGDSEELQSQKAYWQKVNGQHQLPVDKAYDKPVSIQDFKTLSVKLGKEQTKQLIQQVPKVYHTEVNDILLAALAQTISQWSFQQKVSIGMEGHGREDVSDEVDVSRTMGWFTSLYPIVLELEPKIETSDLIKSIKEQLRKIPVKGIGYGVLKYINEDPTLQGSDPWEIVFNYLGQLDNAVKDGKYLHAAKESAGAASGKNRKRTEKLAFNSSISNGDLIVNLSYSQLHFEESTILNLVDNFLSQIKTIITHCLSQKQSINTPSDFGLSEEISYQELDHFLNGKINGVARNQQIESIYRLSGLQEGMLFHSLFDKGSSAYKERFSWDLFNVKTDLLSESWNHILKKHSILRTAFYSDVFSISVQCVYKDVELPISWIDLRHLDQKEQASEIKKLESEDLATGFDFEKAPLMRLVLIRLSEEKYKMFWSSHHILFDGWSLAILTGEFLNFYELISQGKTIDQKQEDRFEDYIRFIERQNNFTEKKYWKNYLNEVNQSTLLPFIDSGSERTKGVGEYETLQLVIDHEITSRVNDYTKKNHITVNTLMQGIWSYLLHEYTRSEVVSYGVVVSGRPEEMQGVEQRVGCLLTPFPCVLN